MAVTESSLKTRFPEFNNATTALVEASISDAQSLVDSAWYGSKTDMAVTYLAAHLLAMNPLAELARLTFKESGRITTAYEQLYKKVRRSIGAGCRVI